MKKLFNSLKTMLCIGLFLATIPAFAQKSVTVTVSDAVGPMAGASVLQKGTTNGTITDLDGNAVVSGLKEGDVLEVSFIGYQTLSVTVGKQNKIAVTLKEDSQLLEETVVVGYGVQKKESLTGAISQIRSEDITNTKGTDALLSLQGKVPGLLIRDMGGKPGAFNTQLSLRGYGTPMIVVDGVVRNTTSLRKTTFWSNDAKSVESYNDMSVLQEINPDDIESVSVLKDASAAIYGLGAANGVILITTKKGKAMKPSVSFSASVRLQQPVTDWNVEDWGDYMLYKNAMDKQVGNAATYSAAELEAYKTGYWQEDGEAHKMLHAAGDPYTRFDWYNYAVKKVAVSQNYNFSLRGGTDKISYYLGLGYSDDSSILRTDNYAYNRFNINGSVTAEIINNLTMTYTTTMRISNQRTLANPDVDWNIQYYIYASEPWMEPHAKDDPLHWSKTNENMNIGAIYDKETSGYSTSDTRSFNNTVDIKYQAPFLKGLSFQLSGAYDYNTLKSTTLTLGYDVYPYDYKLRVATDSKYDLSKNIEQLKYQDEYYELWTASTRLHGRAQVNYNGQFGKHNVGATLAAEMTKNNTARISASRLFGQTQADSFFTHDVINQGLDDTNKKNDGTRSSNATAGYVARLSYNYAGKYLVEAMGRYDGTYMYQKGKRWGFFPSYSLGWRVSEEKFFKEHVSFMNNLKLRWSDGFTGMTQGSAYAYITGYNKGGDYVLDKNIGTPGFTNTTLGNTILTWANVRMLDFGVDFSFFRGKLDGSFDWFKRQTSGIAADSTSILPDFYGVKLPQQNLNKSENEGLELSLSSNGAVGAFNYRVGASLTYTRSRSTFIASELDKTYNSSMNYYSSGSLNRWSGAHSSSRYEWTGKRFTSLNDASNMAVLYSTGRQGNTTLVPGQYHLEDRDGDGYITGSDVYYMWGDSNPPLQFGLNFSGNYKGFDFSVVFSGASLKTKSTNLHAYNGFGYLHHLPKMYSRNSYHMADYDADPWDPTTEWVAGYWPVLGSVNSTGASMPYATYNSAQPYNMIDATYLRLKTLELGYTVQPKFLKKAGIKSLRVYLNAGNLFTLCDQALQFVDPESTDYGRTGGTFQINRSYNIGLNLNF